MKCGACGGGFSKISQRPLWLLERAQPRHLRQSADHPPRRARGQRALGPASTHLMTPELVEGVRRRVSPRAEPAECGARRQHEQASAELDRIQRQIAAIIEAIKDGLRTPGMKDELLALEARKEESLAEIAQVPAPLPRLHPKLAELYRQQGRTAARGAEPARTSGRGGCRPCAR